MARLSHVDSRGKARMVDVGRKRPTRREAIAQGSVTMSREAFDLVRANRMAKGDVLAVAQMAGIQAAKRTWELIPLCHPLPLDKVAVDLEVDAQTGLVTITTTARVTARTGVEMEALTAASVAALTVYDMVKGIEQGVEIAEVALVAKTGGKRDYARS